MSNACYVIRQKTLEYRHFSLIATIWFPGSAWEPNELQALPAVASLKPTTREAEPRRQCVPRQEPGNERIRGGVQREMLNFSTVGLPIGLLTVLREKKHLLDLTNAIRA